MPTNPNKTDTFSVRCPKTHAKWLKSLAMRLKTTPGKLMLDALSLRLPDLEAQASEESSEAA